MQYRLALVCATTLLAFASAQAHAAAENIDRWFLNATQYDQNVTGAQIAKPDFLGGTTMRTQCRWDNSGKAPALQNGIWQLVKYDRAHHIGLAVATTDQCSSSVFKAPTPPVNAADGDLTNYGTGRGLKIGSPYAQVLSLYGPPVKHGQHFVAAYTANVPDTDVRGKPIKLPEVITIVVDNGTVSAITIYVDEGGLF
jgi:hypothetical protein